MKTLLYLAAMTGLFTLPSCLKNDPATPADTLQYPSSQGDYWVYKVTNYQKNTVDTVTVSVVGSMKDPLQSGNFTILQLKWPNRMDSIYASVVNDTIAFYTRAFIVPEDQINYQMNNFIVHPLPMNRTYSTILMPKPNGHYYSDTAKMVSSQSTDINLNEALHGFMAFREVKTFSLTTWGPISEFLIFTDDFIPGIGIIKETKTYRGTGSLIAETWELLNCHLNNPPSSSSVNP